MHLLAKVLAVLLMVLAFLVAVGFLDYAIQAVAQAADLLYALGEQLGGGFRYPKIGRQIDDGVAAVVGPLVVAFVAVAAFEYFAHVKER